MQSEGSGDRGDSQVVDGGVVAAVVVVGVMTMAGSSPLQRRRNR